MWCLGQMQDRCSSQVCTFRCPDSCQVPPDPEPCCGCAPRSTEVQPCFLSPPALATAHAFRVCSGTLTHDHLCDLP